MINIPSVVRVGSMDYDVIEGNETIVMDGLQLYGICDYEQKEIKLDLSTQDEQGVERTFLHELFHAMIFERKINLQSMGLTFENEEFLVDSLALALHQLIRDNRKIFEDKFVFKIVDGGNEND